MSDYYAKRDISAVTQFSDADALFDFGFQSIEQVVFNKDGLDAIEVSFDGKDVHALLEASGPSEVISWSEHVRKQLWVRRANVDPTGSVTVIVMAMTR